MNEIDAYKSSDNTVVAVRSPLLEVDMGSQRLRPNELILVHNTPGRVVEMSGQRKALVQFFKCPDVAVGTAIERTGVEAKVPLLEGHHQVSGLRFGSEGVLLECPRPAFMQIRPLTEKISLGNPVIDSACPAIFGGVHVFLDEDPSGQAFQAIAHRLANGKVIGANTRFKGHANIEGETPYEKWMAIRVAMAQVGHARDIDQAPSTLVAEFPLISTSFDEAREWSDAPPPQSTVVLNDLMDRLVSTRGAPLTVLLRIPTAGLASAAYAETLALGDADVCWVLTADRKIDLTKSTSRLGDSTQILGELHLALKAREKKRLLGEDDLDSSDLAALRRGDEIEQSVLLLLDVVDAEN